MADQAPKRLKHDRATSPEMARLLDVLQAGADDRVRLERLADKLGPLLDAPPPIAAGWGWRSPGLKLIIGGLALFAPGLWFMREQVAKPPAQSAAASEGSALPHDAHATSEEPARAVSAENEKTEPARTPQRARRAEPSARSGGAAALPLQAATSQSAPRRSSPESELHARTQSRGAPAEERAARAPDRAAGSAADSQRGVTTQLEPALTSPLAAAEVPEPRASVPSEAALLFRAHNALADDPSLALRILGEHRARYPRGRLVPERELLAIEALRSLGRSAEADRRVQRFKENFPNSVHLTRLQR
jgi:hypothetical protein